MLKYLSHLIVAQYMIKHSFYKINSTNIWKEPIYRFFPAFVDFTVLNCFCITKSKHNNAIWETKYESFIEYCF